MTEPLQAEALVPVISSTISAKKNEQIKKIKQRNGRKTIIRIFKLMAGTFILGLLSVLTQTPTIVEAFEVRDVVVSAVTEQGTAESRIMSKSELIQDLSLRETISVEEAAQKLFGNEPIEEHRTDAAEKYIVLTPPANTDRTLTATLTKGAGLVYFYCNISEGRGFRAIKKIVYAGYNSGSKIFGGTFNYALPDPNRIHYTLNGHLYRKTSVTVSGGGSVGINGVASMNVSVAATSNYHSPLFIDTNYHF